MNKKGSANKLFVLLIVVVVSSLVISLFSLNVLYGISKSNSLLGGELASFSSQGSSCDGNSDCPSTACFDSTRLFSVACMSGKCDYGHKIADCSSGCSNGACISSTSTSSSTTTSSSTSSGEVLGTISQTCINTCDYYGYDHTYCLQCITTGTVKYDYSYCNGVKEYDWVTKKWECRTKEEATTIIQYSWTTRNICKYYGDFSQKCTDAKTKESLSSVGSVSLTSVHDQISGECIKKAWDDYNSCMARTYDFNRCIPAQTADLIKCCTDICDEPKDKGVAEICDPAKAESMRQNQKLLGECIKSLTLPPSDPNWGKEYAEKCMIPWWTRDDAIEAVWNTCVKMVKEAVHWKECYDSCDPYSDSFGEY